MNFEFPRSVKIVTSIAASLFTLWMVASVVLDYDEQPQHSGPLGVLSASDSAPTP